MSKIKLFFLFSFVTLIFFSHKPNKAYAACFCSTTDQSRCTIGGSCTACIPSAQCQADGQGDRQCATGTGADNGSGGCHCNAESCGGVGNDTPTGYHDGKGTFSTPAEVHSQAFCTQNGWATDPNDRGQDIWVRLLNHGTGAQIGSNLIASNYRSDLEGLCNGGTCAWDINIWNSLSKNTPYQLRAQARDLNDNSIWVNLNTTPRWMMCVDLSCNITGPLAVCPNQPVSYSVVSSGTGVNQAGMYWNVNNSGSQTWPNFYLGAPSGSTSTSFPANNTQYFAVCNAFGPNSSRCTGNPFGVPTGWIDCGVSDAILINSSYANCARPIVNLVSPANNASLASGTTTTTLSASVQFNTYNNVRSREIWTRDVTAGAAFSRLCFFSSDPGDLTFSCNISSLINGHTYQWYATATNEGGPTQSSTWQFTVAAPAPATCTLSLTPDPLNLTAGGVGGTMTAAVTVSGSAGNNITQVTFATSNSGVATRNPATDFTNPYQTTINPITAGSATITATAFLGSGNTCTDTASAAVAAGCAPVAPGTPTCLTTGTLTSLPVNLQWTAPSPNWGTACPSNTNTFRVRRSDGSVLPAACNGTANDGVFPGTTLGCLINSIPDGTYDYTVQASNGALSGPVSTACTFTVSASRNWFRVLGGGVHSNGVLSSLTGGHAIRSRVSDEAKALNLKFLDSAPSGRSDPGILTFNAGSMDLGPAPTGAIAPARLAQGVTFNADRFSYATVLPKISNSTNLTATLVSDGLITPAELGTLVSGTYLITGNVRFDGAYNVSSSRKISFLISGDLILGDSSTPETPTQITLPSTQDGLSGLVFLVGNDIVISPETSRLEGVYVGDGGIITGTIGVDADSPLQVTGTMISYSNITLQRDLPPGQNSTPGELFTYRPDILLSIPQDWISSSIRWQGISP